MSAKPPPKTQDGSPEEPLDILRKKLRFRAWHRGTREVDLIMGSFADLFLDQFDHDKLHQFEALLDAPDLDVYDWIVRGEPVPDIYRNDVIEMLREFDVAAAVRPGV